MIAALLCTLAGWAQQPPAVPAVPAPAFRASTNEILVDVVVRDKRGRMVRGLKATDVTVLENGVPQPVTLFRERRTEGRSAGGTPEATAANSPNATGSTLRLERQVRLVSLVFERLGPEGRRLSRQAALDFLKNDLGANVYYAVFTIDRGFRVIQPYTANRELLDAAIRKAASGERADYANNAADIDRIRTNSAGSVGASAGAAGGPGSSSVDGGSMSDEQANVMATRMSEYADMVTREDFGRVSIFSLWAVIKELASLPGRKSVLYFSEQLEMPNGLVQQFKSMISAATRANVSVYAIDARGLQSGSDLDRNRAMLGNAAAMSGRFTRGTATAGEDGREEFRTFDKAMDSIRASTQNALAELAESTGGFLISNTNDFRKPLAKLSEDFNTYYEIAYRPADQSYDGRFRQIEVRVGAKDDYQVQARNGYYALPTMDGQNVFPFEVPLLNALGRAPLPRDIEFRAHVVQYRQQEGQQQALLIFDLPMKGVTFTKDEQGKLARSHISVLSLVKDAQGQVVSKLSRDVPLNQPLDKVEGFMQGRFIVTRPLLLAPGRYTVESALADLEGQRLAARKAVLVVPKRADGLSMSELVLLRRMEPRPETVDANDPTVLANARVIPTLADTVTRPGGTVKTALSAYLVVYPAEGRMPRLVLDLVRDGKVAARMEPTLPAIDREGRIPFVSSMPVDGVAPGLYEFRATVIDGDKGLQRSLMVTIE
ncbi:MAG: VWA domain-containing protein [Acidobacteria bacterium]|nr:VWA domain-containing protein [Acidobacteriota bacterium]